MLNLIVISNSKRKFLHLLVFMDLGGVLSFFQPAYNTVSLMDAVVVQEWPPRNPLTPSLMTN